MDEKVERLGHGRQIPRGAGTRPDTDRSPAASGSHHPDLRLLVHHDAAASGNALSYQLEVQNPRLGLSFDSYPSMSLTGDPLVHFKTLFRTIERLSQHDAEARRMAEERLGNMGVALFEAILPLDLRRRLWSLVVPEGKDPASVPVLQVISNESWIPWELLKLQDPDPQGDGSGPFLVDAFATTRWLEGHPETLELPLRDLALVVPGDSSLPSAADEREIVRALASGERRVTQLPARFLDVTSALASGRYDGWHFAGHGLAVGENPELWSLQLEIGEQLTPIDLRGQARKLGQARPLVFLNACHSARGGFALTGIGGLAKAFLQAGAGAFIGSHWALADNRAPAFAHAFYQLLLRDLPIGEAVRQARKQIRAEFPGDPTWLAYTVFAHPAARCREIPVREGEPSPGDRQDDSHPAIARRRKPLLSSGERFRQIRPSPRKEWMRSLRNAAMEKPMASLALASSAALAILCMGCYYLGLHAHEARELLLGLDERLHYPMQELLLTGGSVVATLPWKALLALLGGDSVVTKSAWTLLAVTLGWLGLDRVRRLPKALLVSLLGITAMVLASGSALYTIAIRASNLATTTHKPGLTVPQLTGNMSDRIAFETASWLRNDTPRNDDRRESLNGLILWITIATALSTWTGARAQGLTGVISRLRWILVGIHLLLLLFLLLRLPEAHALGEWGLKYPRVLRISAACDPELSAQLEAQECLVYDISAGASSRKLLFVGRCSLDRDEPLGDCEPLLGPKSVVGALDVRVD